MTLAQGASEEDADWLDKNLNVATLPKGERWHFGQPEDDGKRAVTLGQNGMYHSKAR
jgi:hypothetical protein